MLKKKPKPEPEVTGEVYFAADMGNIELIKKLMAVGKGISDADPHGFTGLHFACGKGKVDVARFLLENGADVNAKTEIGATPLMSAAHSGQEEVVDELLQMPEIDLLAETNKGHTASDFAHANYHASIAAKLDQKLKQYWRVDDVFAACKDPPDINFLKYQITNKGGSANQRTPEGFTLLMLAVMSAHPLATKIVRFLIQQNDIDVNATEPEKGNTALLLCCQNMQFDGTEVLELLLSAPKLNWNQPDSAGLTPFMWCVKNHRLDFLEMLIQTKQRTLVMNNKTNDGKSVEDICTEIGKKELFAWLQSKVQSKSQLTPPEENRDDALDDGEEDSQSQSTGKDSSLKKSRTETPASSTGN
eukprot:TRINITY_DN20682_c0_g1_i1.p1 TRINITY_DN20682_c0_g1~~TRINITY_DN20682_c0_g1_i1.p1  ORF type:complete len:359 (+),score=45.05 TRINITY_DN20682_c0_g1_i1:290-1366(+)